MKDQEFFNAFAIAVAVAVVAGVLVGLAAAPAPRVTPAPSNPVDHLYLTISFNPGSGMDIYSPANFSVPSHTLVDITIITYDNGTNLVNGSSASVSGTVGGFATVTGPNGTAREYSFLPSTGISHTFTVMHGSQTQLNVPIPPAPNLVDSLSVTFATYFNETGQLVWMCLAPCDPGSMTSPGFMTGAVTVE